MKTTPKLPIFFRSEDIIYVMIILYSHGKQTQKPLTQTALWVKEKKRERKIHFQNLLLKLS